ncbi:MAG: hypothetical protein QM564_10260 [Bergeyella sp.]
MKKNISFLVILALFSCGKQQAYPPVGGILSEKDMNVSKNRAKNLNELERAQIQSWIDNQDEKFYSMKMNYWVNVEELDKRPKKVNGETVSYQYDIYDFDKVKLYDAPKVVKNVRFGKFDELKAVEDALHYTNPGEKVKLLIPSVLAFGTYGDEKKISNDMPLIIELKTL